jgi:hypothetical protein
MSFLTKDGKWIGGKGKSKRFQIQRNPPFTEFDITPRTKPLRGSAATGRLDASLCALPRVT